MHERPSTAKLEEPIAPSLRVESVNDLLPLPLHVAPRTSGHANMRLIAREKHLVALLHRLTMQECETCDEMTF